MLTTEEKRLLERPIPRLCTHKTVRAWLEARELPVSYAWGRLFTEKIWPLHEKGEIPDTDLIRLLGSAEEYGHQHVFLFHPRKGEVRKVEAWLEHGWLEGKAREANLNGLLGAPRALDMPEQPTWADIRRGTDKNGKPTLVLKEVMRRAFVEEEIQEEHDDGTQIVKRWPAFSRAVNVAQLRSSGRLEVRLAMVRGKRKKYSEELEMFKERLACLLSWELFERRSLQNLKTYLWEKRDALAAEVRVRETVLADDRGVRVSAEDIGTYGKSIVEHEAADEALVTFHRDRAHCESHDVYFVAKDPLPEHEVHVRIPRASNELVIPARCTKDDYEHVMGRLHSLARAASKRS